MGEVTLKLRLERFEDPFALRNGNRMLQAKEMEGTKELRLQRT